MERGKESNPNAFLLGWKIFPVFVVVYLHVCASRNDADILWNRLVLLVTLHSISPVYSIIRNQNPNVSNFNFHELKYLKIKKMEKRMHTQVQRMRTQKREICDTLMKF